MYKIKSNKGVQYQFESNLLCSMEVLWDIFGLSGCGWYHKSSLSPPVKKIFTDFSKAMLLLWIIFVIYVSCLSCFLVCLL